MLDACGCPDMVKTRILHSPAPVLWFVHDHGQTYMETYMTYMWLGGC